MEDLRQDNILATRLSSFRKLRPEHLDIAANILSDTSCNLAVDELKKMNNYKTPRDKMICISNCCKIIFNVLTRVNPKEAPSADTFLPVLIFLVMRANPPHLHSNLKYIMEYRNPDKMISEAGYFLTNLQSTVMFWTNVDHTGLSIDKQEFEKLMNAQYFTDDDDIDSLPHLQTVPIITKKEEEYEEESDEESENVTTLTEQNDTTEPMTLQQLQAKHDESIEMDEKSSSKLSPNDIASFPMTPISRSEQRNKENQIVEHVMSRETQLNELFDYVKEKGDRKDQLTTAFVQASSINEIRVGDLERLLLEYKQLHEFFSNVHQMVLQVDTEPDDK
jgi:hypothetical protein